MRKLLIASVFVSLCMADFGAFAATGRSGRTSANTQNTTTAKYGSSAASVRSAVRSAVMKNTSSASNGATKTTPVQKTSATASATPTSTARVAKKTTVTKPTTTARAATQKVINMGTKVAGATENTVVSQECQDAYYGCMDAFCMLDNTSGGRCQCSDRNADLDLVLEEIMALDEQSYAMATEGVERLQMGESADEIMARAKAAADGVINTDAKTSGLSNGTKARQLDLNAWKNNNLFAEEDDIFAGLEFVQATQNDLANKTGDALQKAAADLCAKQIPAQCAKSTSFLQLTYAQKIKSDCSAYENSLKQQRNASAEKLQTAQKALRDAALEAYQNENKYDFGQCVVRFEQCLQTTAECGDDYSGCVADTAILDTLYNKKNSNKGVATTKITENIKISSATYDILNTKKIICESVTKQCVNANKKGEVWQQVLKDLAPVIYTAEYNAASNSRMNCISTVVNCVQKSCGSKWDEQTDNFDACLSDPNSIENYCKLEYQRCGADDASGSVRTYIMAKLSALKVDKCTKDIKECLLSEDRCGPDYSGCVGLDSDSIVDLCPESKLLSCQDRTDGKNGVDSVRDYIAQIAQGLALNIDNKFATACQNAVEAALDRVCGSSEADESGVYCPALQMDNKSIKGSLSVAFYDSATTNDNDGFTLRQGGRHFYSNVDDYIAMKELSIEKDPSDPKSMAKVLNLIPVIIGQVGIYEMKFTEGNQTDSNLDNSSFEYAVGENNLKYQVDDGFSGKTDDIVAEMNQRFKSFISQIESDTTVRNCMVGRTFRGFNGKQQNDANKSNDTNEPNAYTTVGRNGKGDARFPALTKSVKAGLANQIISQTIDAYNTEMEAAREKLVAAYDEVKNRYAKELKEKELDDINTKQCAAKKVVEDKGQRNGHKWTYRRVPSYDKTTNICTVLYEEFTCYNYNCGWLTREKYCGCYGWHTSKSTESAIQMDTLESLQQQ